MTPARRREEVAALLTVGVCRLRAAKALAHGNGLPESGFDLGFSGHQRVQGNPANQSTESR